MSPMLWGELTEMDAAFRSQLLYHVKGTLFPTPNVRYALRPSSASFRSAPLPAPHSPSLDMSQTHGPCGWRFGVRFAALRTSYA